MSRLNLDCLPIFNTSKKKELEWLATPPSLMLSSRERHLREKSMKSSTANQKNAKINLKDSLFFLFMHFSGLQKGQARIFDINNPDHDDVHIFGFVSCLRLRLDATILSLHDFLMSKIRSFLSKLTEINLCSIVANSDKLRL